MSHIAVRRAALMAASISFSVLAALVLVVSAVCAEGGILFQSDIPVANIQPQEMSFPYAISCTSLVVDTVASYDGLFYEDGSGREVLGAAAILLRNTSEELIPYCHIVLHTDSESYIFEGFLIPGGTAVLIPEKTARPYLQQEKVTGCAGWSTVLQGERGEAVSVKEGTKGQIKVENLSDSSIQELTIYHKTYLQESDIYVGGRAFESKISSIGARETVTFQPINYAPYYSKIVYYE